MEGRLILYSACVIGAIGVYLLLRKGPGRRGAAAVGALLGLGTFGFLLVEAGKALMPGATPQETRPELFFLLFSALALFSSIKMITTSRPVYAALYFVLVVISSAGLFLLLAAEFMTFALVIVYAGAILITYLFVLMLAQQSPTDTGEGTAAAGAAEYDVNPREPAMAAVVGFVLLAVLGDMLIHAERRPFPPTLASRVVEAWQSLELMPGRLEEAVKEAHPQIAWPPDADSRGQLVRVDPVSGQPFVVGRREGSSTMERFELPGSVEPDNTRRVGLALVADFPVSLELAGVILTMAMFGAVVLARRQIELDDAEKRTAAGLRPLISDALEMPAPAAMSQGGGAS